MTTTQTSDCMNTASIPVRATVMVDDLGGGVYRVDGEMIAGPAKMLSAVSSALNLHPKPRQRKTAVAEPAPRGRVTAQKTNGQEA